MAGILGNVIGGLLGLGQGAIEARTAKRNTDATIDANRKMAEYQYSKDLEMWNRANEYNSPASQMQRYTSAGLNPNLIYGSGSASAGNTATSLPKYQAPTAQYNYKPGLNLTNMLSQYQDYNLRQAQIDNVKQDTVNKATTNALNSIMLTWKGPIESSKWYNLKEEGLQKQIVTDAMLKYYEKQKQSELNKTQLEVVSKSIDNAINQIDLNWARPNQWINAGSKIISSITGGIPKIGGKLRPTNNPILQPKRRTTKYY